MRTACEASSEHLRAKPFMPRKRRCACALRLWGCALMAEHVLMNSAKLSSPSLSDCVLQHSYYDSQMTSDSPPSKVAASSPACPTRAQNSCVSGLTKLLPVCSRQRHAESYYDSQMTTDSSGAYDSQSQGMTLSQGESQEMRSTFSANHGKRGSSMRPPLSGSGAYSQSPTVSVTLHAMSRRHSDVMLRAIRVMLCAHQRFLYCVHQARLLSANMNSCIGRRTSTQ